MVPGRFSTGDRTLTGEPVSTEHGPGKYDLIFWFFSGLIGFG